MSALGFLVRALTRGRLHALDWLGAQYPVAGPLRLGPRRALLLNTPELVEEVLVQRVDEFRKGPALRVYARPLLGDGILSISGELHKKHRRLVAPAFAHQRVFKYADVMSSMAQEMVRSWTDGSVIGAHREMTRLTLGIVGRTLFDCDLLDEADSLAPHITALLRFAAARTRSPLPIPYVIPTPGNKRAWQSVKLLDGVIYGMINARRASGADRGDLLSMLLLSTDEDGVSLTDQQVRDEAMTLFLAGHETTANATTWALHLLAAHPDVQDALREEVRGAVGDREITFADLPKLPLALEVFKESMRMYPPAFLIVREALEPTKVAGFDVRRGELLIIAPYLLHKKPEFFPAPERFDPRRFTPEREATIPKYAYLPFGAGRRVCIGNQFALMEGQIILATVVRGARLSLVDQTPLEAEPVFTLRPKGAAPVRIQHAT